MVQKNSVKQKLVLIVGQTAVGKTALGVKAAKRFGGEIISADSAQVYRGLDIGSAKVTPKEACSVAHHLIDIVDPTEQFNASDFEKAAKAAIADIVGRKKRPIVVGGTGLYIKALLFGLSVDVGKDEQFRSQLDELEKERGEGILYELLKAVDPESAATIHPRHKSRIVRALEIYHMSGKKKSDFVPATTSEFDYLLLCPTIPREELYKRIDARVDEMLRRGLIKEVESLIKSGVSPSCQAMSSIGYKETYAYLSGELDYPKYVSLLKQNSRNYAKRQETFFKKLNGIQFVDAKDSEKILKLIGDFYGKN